MRVFTCGVGKYQEGWIKRYLGIAEYIDVTEQYEDIFAMNADVVVVSIDNCSSKVVAAIREYEKETAGMEDRKYIYIINLEFWVVLWASIIFFLLKFW